MTMVLPFLLALCSAFFGTGMAAPIYRNADLQVELVNLQDRWNPKDSLGLGIYFKLQPGWHVYWKNPGDTGKPTLIEMSSAHLEFSDALYPVPQVIDSKLFKSLGYSDRLLVQVDAHARGDLKLLGQIQVSAKVEWALCRDSCIPGQATLDQVIPVTRDASVVSKNWNAVFEEFQRMTPRRFQNAFPQAVAWVQSNDSMISLKLTGVTPTQVWVGNRDLVEQSILTHAEESQWNFSRLSGVSLPKNFDLLLEVDHQFYELVSPIQARHAETSEFLLALIFAFIGGLVLNAMPCVFPVLLLKVYSWAKDSGLVASERLRGALGTALGVVIGFIGFALVMSLTRLGQGQGWGFQMQSPSFVLGLIVIVHVVALQFLGALEFSVPSFVTQNAAAKRLVKSSSSVASGILLVILSTPCTAPFMGGALAYGLSQGVLVLMSVFASLALGLSAPLILLSLLPAGARFLPKPGSWLIRFKQFLAFPMWATMIWLIWVLGSQRGLEGVLVAMICVGALGFSVWFFQGKKWIWLLMSGAAILVYGLLSLQNVSRLSQLRSEWIPYSDQKLVELTHSKQGVFIDFTAAWCITCQINKKTTLERAETLDLFRQNKVVLLRADWTDQSAEITAALRRYGEAGVPHYVLYKPGSVEPLVLPKILTRAQIEKALQ